MPKPSLSATTTVTQTVDVKLTPHVKAMLKARFEEHARLAAEIDEREARQKRIRTEVDELFEKEGQGAALADGTTIDGFRVKRVAGTSRKLNAVELMRALNITKAELDGFYDEKENKPYIKITAPGKRGEHEDE